MFEGTRSNQDSGTGRMVLCKNTRQSPPIQTSSQARESYDSGASQQRVASSDIA